MLAVGRYRRRSGSEFICDGTQGAAIVYVADHAFGPYGERTLDEVRDRTELLARYLDTAGIDLIVIACNSASAAALHHLREHLPLLAFVGMEPAVKLNRARKGQMPIRPKGRKRATRHRRAGPKAKRSPARQTAASLATRTNRKALRSRSTENRAPVTFLKKLLSR